MKISVPPSKSHTLRAILFGSLASKTSIIRNYLPSPDTQAMICACRKLGAAIEEHPDYLMIQGKGLSAGDKEIDAGNSGQVLRFVGAVAGLMPTKTVITGDASIRERRPVKPLVEGLQQLGASATSINGSVIIQGPMRGGRATIDGADSQPVSGLLIASAFAQGKTELFVQNPGEKPWVGLTLSWFDRLGIAYNNHAFEKYEIPGHSQIEGFDYMVPGDWSSAAYPLAAALIQGREVTVLNVDFLDAQGDKKIVDVLEKMGARVYRGENSVTIYPGPLRGIRIDVNDLIDAITILAVLGCFAEGKTTIVGGAIARKKESDRIASIAKELKKMGAKIEEREDGLIVEPSPLKGVPVQSYSDHRMAMSLAVAALGAEGETEIDGNECVQKSYPGFFTMLKTFSQRSV
ncbi:MAG: 3-phosphoshikimate 1-carboxyvinyltransferase [Verrucomicrobia bacterium]|nr:3-phosphoshikimate 1-carboxyvinyltransferase [Verrucomicrobiota bacterium]